MGAYSPVGRATGSVDLSGVTRTELYSRARQLGVPGRSRMNKEELARAVGERSRQAVDAPALGRRPYLRAVTPAVVRRSFRMVPPLAGVMLSAAIGATTPMLLVGSPGELGAAMRADVPAAYTQPAAIQPRPVPKAGDAPARGGVPSSKRAARPIVLAEASGDSTTGSASQPRTEAPSGDSGPTPSELRAGDDVEPGDNADDSDGGRGDSGEDDGHDDSGPRDGAGSDDHSHGDGKGKGKGEGEDEGKGKGHDKDDERGEGSKGKGKEKRER